MYDPEEHQHDPEHAESEYGEEEQVIESIKIEKVPTIDLSGLGKIK